MRLKNVRRVEANYGTATKAINYILLFWNESEQQNSSGDSRDKQKVEWHHLFCIKTRHFMELGDFDFQVRMYDCYCVRQNTEVMMRRTWRKRGSREGRHGSSTSRILNNLSTSSDVSAFREKTHFDSFRWHENAEWTLVFVCSRCAGNDRLPLFVLFIAKNSFFRKNINGVNAKRRNFLNRT